MSKANVYNAQGKVTGELELNAEHFGVKPDAHLIHQVVLAQQANARRASGHTKTKGEVSGGGKKPWKQKGTGRARQGSIRSPQWVGGGIAHGPRKDKNFSVKINRKVRQKALFMALSDKVSDQNLLIVEPFATSSPKTKIAAASLKSLPIGRRVLFVVPASNPALLRMVRNLQNVKLVTVNTLNVADAVHFSTILFEQAAIPAFEALYHA